MLLYLFCDGKTEDNLGQVPPTPHPDYHLYRERHYPARACAWAQRACALRALVLLLADGNPTVGGGKTF